jgi:hypothetical protein
MSTQPQGRFARFIQQPRAVAMSEDLFRALLDDHKTALSAAKELHECLDLVVSAVPARDYLTDAEWQRIEDALSVYAPEQGT